jgi:predicted ATPase
VLSSIAQGIGLRDEGDRPLPDRLCSYLEHARVLILLDNFEHLIAAAPAVTQILQATTVPRVVVTSRAPLHVSGEQEYEVPPLQVPDPESATVAAVAGCESVRLFTERARAVRPGFALDEDNAGTIAAIARRLDGLPLAVELAAARVKLLPHAYSAGAGGRVPGRGGSHQPQHRGPAMPFGAYHRHARRPHLDQAGLQQPGATGGLGLRVRAGAERWVVPRAT